MEKIAKRMTLLEIIKIITTIIKKILSITKTKILIRIITIMIINKK